MSFGHDPEVPAGYQDADIEMMEMREAANEAEEANEREREQVTPPMFDDQDLTVLLELVVKAQAEEMIDGILIQNSPSQRLVALKSLEMRIIRLRGPLQ